MIDYCTLLPEHIKGIYIGDCCKKHDQNCGKRGGFNYPLYQYEFYKDLVGEGVSLHIALLIAFGGAIGCLVKSPWLIYKKIKYRMENK